jgi:chromosome segregation ATPase
MKTASTILSIVAIVAAGVAAYFYFSIGNTAADRLQQLQSEQAQHSQTRQQLGEAQTRSEDLATRLATLDTELGDTRSRLSSSQARASQLERDLNQARTQLAAREQTEQDLGRQLTSLRNELIAARTAASQATDSAELVEARQRVRQLENRLNTMEGGSPEAETTQAAAPVRRPVPADLAGNVLEVGPRSSFVVLGVGGNQGAQEDVQMAVRRGDREIARVVLSEVHPGYSIGQVVPGSVTRRIRSGDVASLATNN